MGKKNRKGEQVEFDENPLALASCVVDVLQAAYQVGDIEELPDNPVVVRRLSERLKAGSDELIGLVPQAIDAIERMPAEDAKKIFLHMLKAIN